MITIEIFSREVKLISFIYVFGGVVALVVGSWS
jgi:hypothetical protein